MSYQEHSESIPLVRGRKALSGEGEHSPEVRKKEPLVKEEQIPVLICTHSAEPQAITSQQAMLFHKSDAEAPGQGPHGGCLGSRQLSAGELAQGLQDYKDLAVIKPRSLSQRQRHWAGHHRPVPLPPGGHPPLPASGALSLYWAQLKGRKSLLSLKRGLPLGAERPVA